MSQPNFILLKLVAVLAVCAVPWSVRAEEHVAVIKNDRVNLRAKPDMNAEVVAQANAGDRLPVASVQEAWIEVRPPSSVDVWAHRDFIKDGTSTVKSLNLRAGPGINYSIVGTVNRGEAIEVRGQFGEWIKVAPTRATLWISREFLDVVTPVQSGETAAVPITTAEPAVEAPVVDAAAVATSGEPAAPPVDLPAPQPVDISGQQEPAMIQAPAAKAPPSDLRLVPLEGQGRLVRREGELKPAPFLFGRPSSFRLVKREGVQLVTVCYVRGNTAQLNSLMNETLIVHGREYWVQGVRQPVVVLERIDRRAASSRP